ncbi:hypothetical protein ACWJV6_09450 [Clostridioides difficile]
MENCDCIWNKDSDEFELNKGVELCLARIEVKKANKQVNLVLDKINNKEI